MGGVFDVVDLFAGCGGLTSGFLSTGYFKTVAAVEMDLGAAATFAQNFGDHVHVGPIQDWARVSMPRAHVVVGGPPCQGFSNLGKRDRKDPRNALWADYLQVVRRVRPAFFVLENVPQFLASEEYRALRSETGRGGVLQDFAIEAWIVNANDHGVPQARRRAIVIGRRRQMDELGPIPGRGHIPTMADAFPSWLEPSVTDTRLPASTVVFQGRAVPGSFKLRDLHLTSDYSALSMQRFRSVPTGGSRLDLPDELKAPCWRGDTAGSGDVMGRLRWDRASVTIRTECTPEKGRYLHPDEHRAITLAEAALIQGFPEDFLWCGSKTSIARQIGNAVPPPLARAIARHLADRMI